MDKISILKSRSIVDRFPAVFEYFFKEWKGLLSSYFLYVAPLLIFIMGYAGMIGNRYVKAMENMDFENPGNFGEIFANIGLSSSDMIVIIFLSIISSVMSLSVIGAYITLRERGDAIPYGSDVFSHAMSKMKPLLAMIFFSWILLFFGLIAACIGVFIVLVSIAVAYPAIFMEDLSGAEAIKRSFQLSKKHFMDTLIFFFVLIVTVLFTTLLLNFLLGPIAALGVGILQSNTFLGLIIIGISAVLAQTINIFIYIGQFMHYGHLVEKTENNSLDSEIDAL